MWWLILVVGVVVAYFIYNRKTTTVRMTKEQLELMRGLVAKEKEELKKRKQEIINQGTERGDTIPLAPILEDLDNLIEENKENQEYVNQIEKIKDELIQEYGDQIPVDAAYKLVAQIEDEFGHV